MSGPIEEQYFEWLCAKVLDPYAQTSYDGLLRVLQGTEFQWVVHGDHNRVDEGLELRLAFMLETHSNPDPSWAHTECSVFEMLYALAQKAEFQTSMDARQWFWKMVENLQLAEYRRVTDADIPIIEEVLDNFIWRRYDPSGRGGPFPMRWPHCDMTQAELWYQFCWYVEEEQIA